MKFFQQIYAAVLAACLMFLPALVLAQDDTTNQVGDLEELFAKTMSAHGTFDEADLCTNVQGTCSVLSNKLQLTYHLDHGQVTGRGATTITYNPYPECRAWRLTTQFSNFNGSINDESVMTGTADIVVQLTAAMFAPGECRPQSRTFTHNAIWEATSTGESATGVLSVTGQGGGGRVAFTLEIKSLGERFTPEACPADDPACCPIREIQRDDAQELSTVCGSRA